MMRSFVRSKGSFFGVCFLVSLTSASLSQASAYKNDNPPCEKTPAFSTGVATQLQMGCMNFDKKSQLPWMNTWVMKWLKIGERKCRMRAMVKGVVVNRFDDSTGHRNYEFDLDNDGRGDLTLVYQNEFGTLPDVAPGTTVVACGDFIKDDSIQHKDGRTITLPGLIHWVHSNDGARDHGTCLHPDGFLNINGVNYGVSPPGKGLCH